MTTVALVFAALAALLHIYIFWMESIAWTSDRVRRTFGTSADEARATREMAFNQGFYNLFLAIAVIVGIILFVAGQRAVGATLVLVGCGSMLAAAAVLLLSSPDKRRAAITQGTLPLIGAGLLVAGLLV